jgi:hypothetical protein
MRKYVKFISALTVSAAVLMPSAAFAQEFSDMPDNWTTAALERAVENGLLNGADGMIMPDDNITRAQMAAIIVRAFGGDKEADLSAFSDVSQDKWYYSEFAKAVSMKVFAGTDDMKLNPDNFITYQECFTVAARLLMLPDADISCLEKFDDYSSIDEWAKQSMANVVGYGYWDGIDNKLKPKDYITRSEFAVLMDNMVKVYINEPGTYTELPEGNILIRSEDVVIDGLKSDDLIIVGDGVHGTTKLLNMESTNFIIGRGGTIEVTGVINNISGITEGVVLDISKITKRNGKFYLLAKDVVLNIGDYSVPLQ